MKASDQVYPPGILMKDLPVSGIKARDFIAIEAMKSMLQGIYSSPVPLDMASNIPGLVSQRAFAIANRMIAVSE